jgi:hypothetical protein
VGTRRANKGQRRCFLDRVDTTPITFVRTFGVSTAHGSSATARAGREHYGSLLRAMLDDFLA